MMGFGDDREELLALPEVERERIVFERSERRQERLQQVALRKRVKKKKKAKGGMKRGWLVSMCVLWSHRVQVGVRVMWRGTKHVFLSKIVVCFFVIFGQAILFPYFVPRGTTEFEV